MKFLRAAREMIGLSQDELVARLQTSGLDVTRSTVSHWENGRYQLPYSVPEKMRTIASAYGLTVCGLLRSAGYTSVDLAQNLDDRDNAGLQILEAWETGDYDLALATIVLRVLERRMGNLAIRNQERQ